MKNLKLSLLIGVLIGLMTGAPLPMAYATPMPNNPAPQRHETVIQTTAPDSAELQEALQSLTSSDLDRAANGAGGVTGIYTQRALLGGCSVARAIMSAGPAVYSFAVVAAAMGYSMTFC